MARPKKSQRAEASATARGGGAVGGRRKSRGDFSGTTEPASIQRNILRHVRQQLVFQPLLAQDGLPELRGVRVKNQVQRRRMREPGVTFQFILELPRAPAGVTGEGLHFLRGGK